MGLGGRYDFEAKASAHPHLSNVSLCFVGYIKLN